MSANEEKNQLEAIQYEDIYHDDDVPLQDGSDQVVGRLIYFGVGLFIILLIACFLVKLPRQIHLPFVLKGGVIETIFQYHEQVFVKATHVQIGDSVKPGQVLMEIGSQGISNGISEIESVNRDIHFFINEQHKVYVNTIKKMQVERTCFRNEIKDLENELNVTIQSQSNEKQYLKELVSIERVNLERNRTLSDSGYVSQHEIEKLTSSYTNAKQILASTMAKYDLNKAALQSAIQATRNKEMLLVKELEQLQLTHRRDSVALYSKLQQAKKRLETLYGPNQVHGRNIQLTSPVSGKISYMSSNESEVPSREILLKIDNTKQEFKVYAVATSAQVGQLKVGNRVVLKYHSFPYYYYGTMKSEINAISLSSNEDDNYMVVMNITDYGRLDNKVSKGMTGKASVIIEEKSVSDFIWRSFLKNTAID